MENISDIEIFNDDGDETVTISLTDSDYFYSSWNESIVSSSTSMASPFGETISNPSTIKKCFASITSEDSVTFPLIFDECIVSSSTIDEGIVNFSTIDESIAYFTVDECIVRSTSDESIANSSTIDESIVSIPITNHDLKEVFIYNITEPDQKKYKTKTQAPSNLQYRKPKISKKKPIKKSKWNKIGRRSLSSSVMNETTKRTRKEISINIKQEATSTDLNEGDTFGMESVTVEMNNRDIHNTVRWNGELLPKCKVLLENVYLGIDENNNEMIRIENLPYYNKKTVISKNKNRYYYPCSYSSCNRFMNSLSALRYHEMTHINLTKFVCEICSKDFKTKIQLKHHITVHYKNFTCADCDKKYGSKFLLKRHIEEDHLRLYKYQCDKCSMKFIRYRNLRVHKFSHNLEKPFKCNICLVPFMRRQHLTSHMKQHEIASGDKKIYHCLHCSRFVSFRCMLALVRHCEIVHAGVFHPKGSKCAVKIMPEVSQQAEIDEAVATLLSFSTQSSKD